MKFLINKKQKMAEETIHYTRTGYNGDFTYDTICGKKVKGAEVSVSPEKTTCKKCLEHDKHKTDLIDFLGKGAASIKRRIYIESDILKADELRSAQREAYDFAEKQGLKCVDRVFSDVLDYAWHDLEKTWNAVKQADEIYATSSLMPLTGNSYMGAPVIFNGMCERAVNEKVTGKLVIILNTLENIDWGMIDMKIMKKAFKDNDLYMYDESYDNLIKIDVKKIKQ
jgi:hypothetical protein